MRPVPDGWSYAPALTGSISGPDAGVSGGVVTLTISTYDKDSVTIYGVQTQFGNTDRGISYTPDPNLSPGSTNTPPSFPSSPSAYSAETGLVEWQHSIHLIVVPQGEIWTRQASYTVVDTDNRPDRHDSAYHPTHLINIAGPAGSGGGG